jgi:hypothetical protein
MRGISHPVDRIISIGNIITLSHGWKLISNRCVSIHYFHRATLWHFNSSLSKSPDMKNLLPLSFLMIFLSINAFNVWCQKKEDVVYLSDGSIIRGIAQVDSTLGVIRILNHAGDKWVFNLSDMDSLTREKPFEYKALLFNQKGLEYNINAEFLIRSRNNAIGNAVIPGIDMVFGYRINPYFSAGAGMGLEFYETMEIPFSVSVRARMSARALSPFALVKAGYTMPAEKRPSDWNYDYTSYGGFNGSIGFGIERILNENASFLLSFSYHYQALNYKLTPLGSWVQERTRKEMYSRFRFTLGYLFK